jgi:hypothetical protein
LILSDITEMGSGLCVIGIEQVGKNEFHSVRPMPPMGYAWPLQPEFRSWASILPC